jgi:hypothetical protein
MTAGIKANVDGSAAIQVGGTDVITLTSGGAATFVTSPTTVQAGTAAAPSITFSGDTNTGIYSPGADQVAIGTGGTEALRVNSSQSLLLNTTSAPAASAKMKIATSARTGAFFDLTATGGENWIIDSTNTTGSTDVLGIYANGATGLYIQDTGNVGVGTTSPGKKLDVSGDIRTSSTFIVTSNGTGSITDGANTYVGLSSSQLTLRTDTAIPIVALTNGTERARITSGGDLLVGKTSGTITTAGAPVYFGALSATRDAEVVATINRLTNDGGLVSFRQDSTEEGSISVSGTTVSYNGGHLARYSQLLSGQRDESIVKGTVLSNLDEMCEWTDAEGNPLPNEQLNRMKVSDVEGDTNVAGVFVNWDNDDQDNPYDMNIAMTGDMIIRIAQGVTVQKGDLLMSAGDGTAKPQGDDIVRSKTVAKVTSNHVTCTYDDGSYCVPCVLMAC